ncbi:LysR family transcriptional regulator [Burkholderia sp. Ac-20384]|jgi:DNA-binding transcriptional LysR family regulator|uniref:Transcriptional regulator, LysR family n=2 Tax=Burkholderia lata (strain ATCC 17760 / DSM 23089 / LMG 22485 / NCIMB 9086 / R18194 / 383) TaxID=482957 RepID=Q397N5_BURL3|nr:MULTISPECIES: LysR family transcriptional regulator [Burkholderia]ABB11326.1 transcriptional regulator, LysR family [Burkholderia lata]KAF1041044.1 MAG: HTH-type transcriptional regulator PgrR [Burkholderia lata]MBN3822829.1 LysR family transcriptional regulator [Burkholderia sp. Ac-20384]
MNGNNLKDLTAFLLVAEEGSFTRAAARLGISQSALSQVIRALETRLGLQLFARTTRSVSLTAAGSRLLELIGPAMGEIDSGLDEITHLRDKPAGTIRLNADEYAVQHVLQPAVTRLLPAYPDIRVELNIDYGLTDIVSGRYDAGVRRGGLVAKDMIAVQISPPHPMSVVGAPAYFASRPAPKLPRDLTDHLCINLRLPTHGEYFPWVFAKAGKEQRVKVDGQLVGNSIGSARDAALSGLGLAHLPHAYVAEQLASGQLVEALSGWRKTYEPYYLYYPSRRHASPAFSLVVDALRYRG